MSVWKRMADWDRRQRTLAVTLIGMAALATVAQVACEGAPINFQLFAQSGAPASVNLAASLDGPASTNGTGRRD